MLPNVWTSLFTTSPDIYVLAARYLAITGIAYVFLGLGLTLASSFQAAGRPLWPLIGITGRAAVVAVGGWIVVHRTGAGLDGLAAVAAAGLAVYGASLAIAFRAGFWRTQRPQTAPAATKS
jgi:Na+-driven multidrug efflux pump